MFLFLEFIIKNVMHPGFKSHDIYKEFERLSSFNYEDVKGLEVCQDVPDEELYAFIMFLKERGFINGD